MQTFELFSRIRLQEPPLLKLGPKQSKQKSDDLSPLVFSQDNSLLSVGGQPGGNPEASGDERPAKRHSEVAAEPPERQHGAQGDVRPRHRTLLERGGLHADGEGHEDSGHAAG